MNSETKDKLVFLILKGLIVLFALAIVGWTISTISIGRSGFDAIKEYAIEYSKNLNVPNDNKEYKIERIDAVHPYNQCLLIQAKEFENASAEGADMFCAKLLTSDKK